MIKRFTFEEAAAAIETADGKKLSAMRDNLPRYFADRPDELARLEQLVDARMKPALRTRRTTSLPRRGLKTQVSHNIGRSDILAAIEQYNRDPKAFFDQGRAREPKWVYLVDEADDFETRYPLKAIGLHLLGYEAHECTTNDIERRIDFEGLGFKVIRALGRPMKHGDGA